MQPARHLLQLRAGVGASGQPCLAISAVTTTNSIAHQLPPSSLPPSLPSLPPPCSGRPTDVYALGACLYTLLFGRIPFSAPNLYKLFQVVQNEPVKYPPDVPITEELKDLLARMLTKVRRARHVCGALRT